MKSGRNPDAVAEKHRSGLGCRKRRRDIRRADPGCVWRSSLGRRIDARVREIAYTPVRRERAGIAWAGGRETVRWSDPE
jgi:hypothetical protein